MDPITIGATFALAQASVRTIKEALKLGKDIFEVSGDITTFFSAHSQINTELIKAEQAQRDSLREGRQKDYYEITAIALDIAIKQRQIVKDEAEIKTMLIWSGNGDVYHAMIKERLRLEKEQALAQSKILSEKMVNEKLRQEKLEVQKDIAIAIGIILIVAVPFIVLVQWGIDQGYWASGKNDPRIVYQTQKIR
jgi:hypothetical protein